MSSCPLLAITLNYQDAPKIILILYKQDTMQMKSTRSKFYYLINGWLPHKTKHS